METRTVLRYGYSCKAVSNDLSCRHDRTDHGAAAELASALGAQRDPAAGWRAVPPTTIAIHPSASPMVPTVGFLLTCFAGCSWSAIRDALRARSLWPRGDPPRPAVVDDATGVAPSSAGRRACCREAHLAIATPAPGTLVETYLRSRSLTTPVPPTLRYARSGIGRAVDGCPAWWLRSRRPTVASPACTAPTCGRTVAARRTWTQSRRCSARVAAALSGSPLSDHGLPL